MPLSLSTYEAIRGDPQTFIVAPGHELPEIEIVVDKRAGFTVVRKEGEAARIAEDLDPRG